MRNNNLKPLAITFVASGIWDTIAGILYTVVIGTGRLIDDLPADPFYMRFLGSFFFCFACLQFLSALNIQRYSMNIGCLILGRLLYVIQLYCYLIFVSDFPHTFWFTGIIDGAFVVLYISLAYRGGLSIKDLFVPVRESNKKLNQKDEK